MSYEISEKQFISGQIFLLEGCGYKEMRAGAFIEFIHQV
jgi:hypothetical protein